MLKLLNISALAFSIASLATCEARSNLRKLQSSDYLPAHSGNEEVRAKTLALAHDEALVESLEELISEGSGTPPEGNEDARANILALAHDEALVASLEKLISEDSGKSSSDDTTTTFKNYDEIPVPESSSDSADYISTTPNTDPYAATPSNEKTVSKTIPGSSSNSGTHIDSFMNVRIPENAQAVSPGSMSDTKVKDDSVANNYFVDFDSGSGMVESSEEDSSPDQNEEDVYLNYEELPVTNPEEFE